MKHGVLDLLPDFPGRRTFSHAVMEWKPLIRIYNSRWYRYSLFATWLFGISFDEESALISTIADLEGQETVLDLACGPGTYTRLFAKQLPRGCVVGVDLSVPMLSYASSWAHQEPYQNVMFLHGHAEKLAFPDEEFDHVNCCGALHLFSDLPTALKEIHRVLKPKGTLTATAYRNWIPGSTAKRLAEWQYRAFGTNYFHAEDLEQMMQTAGLHEIVCHHERRYWIIMSARKPGESGIGM
jgi:ubiquinone/menaquinone biosynthesis C-methylase UbiE